MTPLRTTATAVATLLLLAGCDTGEPTATPASPATSPSASAGSPDGTGTTDAPTSPGTARSAGPSESTTSAEPTVEIPPAPPEDACYRLRLRELTEPTSSRDPVPCTDAHNAQTVHVGELDTVVDGHSVAVDSRVVQEQLASTCPGRLASYVGGSPQLRALSRFEVVWYSPTLEQSDRGATWFRCDLVAFATSDRLADLPRPSRLESVLDEEGALDTWGLCGTAAPGTSGFSRVICSRDHSWRAVATIDLGDDESYPGTASVRSAGDEDCRDVASEGAGSATRFEYGWEWPTRAQWQQGQRYGFCWAPD